MRKFKVLIGVLAVLLAGCGSNDSEKSAAKPAAEATATATATPEATATASPTPTPEPFEKGHSRAVRRFYGGGKAPVPPWSDVEAEYHQPPRPATGGIGDTITLTGTNIGVRLRTTVTGLVDPARATESPGPGKRYVGVQLRLRSTGIAIHDSPLESARLRYEGGAAKPVLGVKAGCSNGFDGTVRIDVGLKARGCLLFEVPENAEPREFVLALETVPPPAGGRWRLR
jgi:hypothetical protein